jgi:hypothetical protein
MFVFRTDVILNENIGIVNQFAAASAACAACDKLLRKTLG